MSVSFYSVFVAPWFLKYVYALNILVDMHDLCKHNYSLPAVKIIDKDCKDRLINVQTHTISGD